VRTTTFTACLWLLLAAHGFAAELPIATPAEVGIGRLDRISTLFKTGTDNKRLPGAVVMIARNGKVVYHEAFGARDPATGAPMQKDSMFRMCSITKPITGVAVLMEGKIRLTDPVLKYLPALKSTKVMTEITDGQGRRVTAMVPANREITIQDLMRHTSGITYSACNSAAEQAMTKAGIGLQLGAAGDKPVPTRLTDQQVVEEIGKLPLCSSPAPAGNMAARSMCCWR
jgi:CubicO group peptidase (beta-lactamase class C family)